MWAEILRTLNVKAARAAFRKIAPHLPQPKDDVETLVSIHMARTKAECVPLVDRWYSYDWLVDKGYPAEPPEYVPLRKVTGVAYTVLTGEPEVKEAITGAVNAAIEDCYANGDRDPLIVKPQMMAARARERRGLMLPREVT